MEIHDEKEIRCPQLGGPVPFKYCRSMNRKLPCQRIVVCWQGKIDIADFLAANYSEEDLTSAFEKDPRTRIQKIIQLAEESRKK